MTAAPQPLVILDRDGVINRDSVEFIKSPEEFLPLPGSIEAIAALTQAGYRVVVASNQSGLGRGLFSVETLDKIHAKLHAHVTAAGGRVLEIFYCPHKPDEGCRCRKPLPGLFEKIAERFACDLNGVPAIGDSMRDLEAAEAAGAQPILVRTGNGKKTESKLRASDLQNGANIPVYDDLRAAANAIVKAIDRGNIS